MKDGRHGGPEGGGVFGLGEISCRCEVRAMPQMALLAVLDSALREVEAVLIGAHPELADWPTGDERWLHDDYVLYTAFSLATMAYSLRYLIACYHHRAVRRDRARDGTGASPAGAQQQQDNGQTCLPARRVPPALLVSRLAVAENAHRRSIALPDLPGNLRHHPALRRAARTGTHGPASCPAGGESRISHLASRISDLGSRISHLASRISHLVSRISYPAHL